jgi:preprotein translocase subunit SecE
MADAKPRLSVINFIKQVKLETQKVTWPTRKETTVTVVMVLIFAAILATYFLFVDGCIGFLIRQILG